MWGCQRKAGDGRGGRGCRLQWAPPQAGPRDRHTDVSPPCLPPEGRLEGPDAAGAQDGDAGGAFLGIAGHPVEKQGRTRH